MNAKQNDRAKPFINVTPLIDVLLVMLIIFMVVVPIKPSRFKATVPEPLETNQPQPEIGDLLLRVDVLADNKLTLNGEDAGTVENTTRLSARLAGILEARLKAGMANYGTGREWRTVFIKAPRAIKYGEVAKVIDGVKSGGADPIGLQIDALN